MKKLTIKDDLENFADFVKDRCSHYEQRLKWHDEDISEINRLISLLFLENIAILVLLIIWSW